jgi:chemotaxis protein MotB
VRESHPQLQMQRAVRARTRVRATNRNGVLLALATDMNRSMTLLACAALLGGCVSESKYDLAVKDAQRAKTELNQATVARTQQKAELDRLQSSLADLDNQCAERKRQLTEAEGKTTALSSSLQDSRARLAELERAKLATEQRAALFHDLAQKLKSQLDDGQLSLIVRDGRMVLALPNDVLFDSGHTEIKAAAKPTLKLVAEVMKLYPRRQFQIAGHTDNVPIHTERFDSNWELSAGRALEVVHYLTGQGVKPAELSMAGYADVDPVAPNDNDANKRKNRRLEITLQPNIDELVYVPR